MRIRSMVGLIPLYACLVLEDDVIKKLPGFRKRLQWFLDNRQDIAKQVGPFANVCALSKMTPLPHLSLAPDLLPRHST